MSRSLSEQVNRGKGIESNVVLRIIIIPTFSLPLCLAVNRSIRLTHTYIIIIIAHSMVVRVYRGDTAVVCTLTHISGPTFGPVNTMTIRVLNILPIFFHAPSLLPTSIHTHSYYLLSLLVSRTNTAQRESLPYLVRRIRQQQQQRQRW